MGDNWLEGLIGSRLAGYFTPPPLLDRKGNKMKTKET